MFKLNQYSDYFNNDDPNYPNGKAVDTTTAEGVDGTPLLAKWMNNVQGAFEAIYKKAFGDLNVSGNEDNSNASDVLNAIEKIVDDGDTATLNAAKVDATNKANQAEADAIATAAQDATNKANQAEADAIAAAAQDATNKANQAKASAISTASADATTKANAKVTNSLGTSSSVAPSQAAVATHTSDTTAVHGSVSTATANRIIQRDGAGRAKVAAPSANDDIARLDTVNNKVVNNNTGSSTTQAMSQSAAKSYANGRTPVYITEYNHGSTNWYRRWSNGKQEAGGILTSTSSETAYITVTMPITFTTVPKVFVTANPTNALWNQPVQQAYTQASQVTTTTFRTAMIGDGTVCNRKSWYATNF